jgi:N6-adenosine-specific RNA methylase IME4
MTVNRRMAKGHGFYLQHAKETCLVGKKGTAIDSVQQKRKDKNRKRKKKL